MFLGRSKPQLSCSYTALLLPTAYWEFSFWVAKGGGGERFGKEGEGCVVNFHDKVPVKIPWSDIEFC